MKEIEKIRNILMTRLKRLDDDYYMKDNLKDEVLRSNAVTNASLTYIKMVNLELKVKELSSDDRKLIKKTCE